MKIASSINLHYILTWAFLSIGTGCLAQDSIHFLVPDLTWEFSLSDIPTYSFSTSYTDYSISHNPSEEDSLFSKTYSKLIKAEPTIENHLDYHALACSLWELGRLEEAETMFLKIVDSKEPYYVGTYYNSSDIPGDTGRNIYGYGSYTSNYKNYACRYLSKIYLEERKFEKALEYIEYADNKYQVEQNCGTGYRYYRTEIDGLYSLSYEGLEMYDSIIIMFLPDYFNHANGTLTRALKKVYSMEEINTYLSIAENSIECLVDTFQSSAFITEYNGDKIENTRELNYYSGTASMLLFGKQVTLPTPNLENGESVSKERYAKEFRESGFYTSMIADE